MSPGPRLRLALLAAVVGGLFAAVALSGSFSSARVRDWVDGYGAAGPLVFVALSACLTVALFPGPLLAGASGLLFGTALGTPVSIVAATAGALAAFAIARGFGHRAVEELAGRRLRGWQAWIERRGFLAVLYLRIAPGVPYNLVNYGAGLSRVRVRDFAGGTATGVTPRAFAYTALGGNLDDLGSPEALIAIALLVLMALAGVVLWRREPGPLAATAAGPGRGSSSPAGRSAGRP